MSQTPTTRKEIAATLAKGLRGALDSYAEDLRTLRARELQKNMDAGTGGQGDVPLAMSEQCMCKGDGAHETCSGCGKSIVSLAHNTSGKCGSCNRKPPAKTPEPYDKRFAKPVKKTVEDPTKLLFETKEPKPLHPSDKKPIKKDEKTVGEAKTAPDARRPGSKLPEDAKPAQAADAPGSGGLKKTAMPGAKIPKVPGTPGKQPVGQGGGDSPGRTSVAQANAEIGKMKSIASSPTAMPTGAPVVGAPAPKPAAPAAAAPAPAGKLPGPLQGVRDSMNLGHDMKAGGVGWLQRLVASRKPAVAAPPAPGGGSAFGPTSKRATGIATSHAALARSEKTPSKTAAKK